MKMFSVLILFVVSTSPAMSEPLDQFSTSVFNAIDWVVKTLSSLIFGSGNTDCSPNPDCTEYVQNGLSFVVDILKDANYTQDLTGVFDHNVTLLPTFNMSVTEGVCSKKINDTTRRDSWQIQFDNFEIKMNINLVTGAVTKLNPAEIFKTVTDAAECTNSVPRIADIFSTVISPDMFESIPECMDVFSKFGDGDSQLAGSFSVNVFGVRADIDYTAHADSGWVVNFAELNLDNLKISNEMCAGSLMFIPVCECLFKTDTFVRSIILQDDVRYKCIFQDIIDLPYVGLVKCPNFE